MAQANRYICGSCGKAIVVWSDGNPYYIDNAGKKQYAYHPDHEKLDMCIGNDGEHMCLKCGAEFMVDSRTPIKACPKCAAREIADTGDLEGKRCPSCKSGVFECDTDYFCIS
jgi:DNA-directed RNA polymerase subunit RPC12/RpoP